MCGVGEAYGEQGRQGGQGDVDVTPRWMRPQRAETHVNQTVDVYTHTRVMTPSEVPFETSSNGLRQMTDGRNVGAWAMHASRKASMTPSQPGKWRLYSMRQASSPGEKRMQRPSD